MTSKLANRVVVITGASSGIARAAAYGFAREGARLVLAARRAEVLAEVAADCLDLGAAAAVPVPTDVSDHEAVVALERRAIERFGRIDIWVNCAAVLQFGRIEETPPAVIERTIQTNVLGYFYGAQSAIRQFRQQGSGTLINVASVLGIAAQPYASAYVASKFAIRGLSDSVRQEVRDIKGIHVCTVMPFAIDTPIYQRAANYTGRVVSPIAVRYPAETVADAILSCAHHPRREVFGGQLGQLAAWQKIFAPSLTEAFVANAVELSEMTDTPADPSDGNLFEPVYDKYAVDGEWGHIPRKTSPLLLGALAAVAGLTLAVTLRPRKAY